jgi:hypothetical protein
MNQQPNILFYSKLCKSCNIFINQCHKSNILKYFKLVCVDDRINEFKEKGIKIVPTIYKQGHGKPLEGKEAFMWLETIINNGNMTQSTQATPTPATQAVRALGGSGASGSVGNIVKRNIIQPTTTNVQNGSGGSNGGGGSNGPSVKKVLDGYLQDEMTGFSDTYALLLTDDPLPKTFATHNTDQEIYTAPEGPKIDWRTQKTLIRNLETQRTNDL